MFGDNPTRKRDHSSPHALAVHSIFPTIQGEGPFAGCPATFIRFWGCHLACHFCDTDFESHQTTMSVDMLVAQCRTHGHKLVVLTGGEPMRQDIYHLCFALLKAGFRVQIETAGSFWVEGLGSLTVRNESLEGVSIVVSPKTPVVHESIVAHARYWKYLVDSLDATTDAGIPIMRTQRDGEKRALAPPPPGAEVFMQPLDAGSPAVNDDNTKAAVALALKHGYRVCLQQHKILGLP